MRTETVFHAAECKIYECCSFYICTACKRKVGRCMRRFRPKEGEESGACLKCYGQPKDCGNPPA